MVVVKRAANFTRNGVTDWLVQRLTAIILGAYVLVVMFYFLGGEHTGFQSWQVFILSGGMKVFTVIAFISLLGHAWIGLWIVGTDYIKMPMIRFIFNSFYGIGLLAMLVWCIDILWQ